MWDGKQVDRRTWNKQLLTWIHVIFWLASCFLRQWLIGIMEDKTYFLGLLWVTLKGRDFFLWTYECLTCQIIEGWLHMNQYQFTILRWLPEDHIFWYSCTQLTIFIATCSQNGKWRIYWILWLHVTVFHELQMLVQPVS